MARLLKFMTPDGDGAVIASLAPGDDVQAVSRVGDAVQMAEKSLTDVLSVVRGVAFSFREALASAPVESASIELGLQFTAKGNIYVVGAEVQSAVKVCLTVKPPATVAEDTGAAGSSDAQS